MSHILIVEDNEVIQALLDLAFTDAGHTVTAHGDVASGTAAFERDRTTLNAGFIDFDFPGGGAPVLIKNIRTLEPAFPILIGSGLANKWYEALEENPQFSDGTSLGDYKIGIKAISKPYGIDDVIKEIERLIETPPPYRPGMRHTPPELTS